MRVAKITRQIVAQLKPAKPGASYYVMDLSLPGFGIRVYPASAMYVVRFKGRPYNLGPTSILTLDEARKSARDRMSKIWRGEPIGEGTSMTVAELHARYVAATEGRKRTLTNLNESRLWRIHVLPELGETSIQALTRSRVAEWHRSRGETPASANRAFAVLRAAIRWAINEGILPAVAEASLRADLFPEYPRDRVLTSDELDRLASALRSALNAQTIPAELGAVIRLLILTGARPTEILTARAEWIDWQRGAILLPQSKGDRSGRKRGRSVWLGSRALEIVREIAGETGPLFPSLVATDEEDRRGYQKLTRAWDALCKAAGVHGASPYSARHTFVSRGSGAGVGIEGSSDLVGHADIDTTKRIYHHGDDAANRKNIEAMEASLGGVF